MELDSHGKGNSDAKYDTVSPALVKCDRHVSLSHWIHDENEGSGRKLDECEGGEEEADVGEPVIL